jgi:hypothetical protein
MLAAGISAALLISGLAGCSSTTSTGEDTATDATTETLDACQELFGVPGDTVIATVNGEDLLLSEYAYWLSYDANMLGYYYYGSLDAITWDSAYDDENTVAQYAMSDALDVAVNYMVIKQKAAELGLELTDEQVASVDETMESYVTSFGESMWDDAVADGTVVEDDYDEEAKLAWIAEAGAADLENEVALYGTTVDYLRYMAETYQYYSLIQDHYFNDDTVTDDDLAQYVADNPYYSAKSILFMNTTDADGNTVAYSDMDDDQKAALKAEAQAALDDILSSDDPEAKFEEYQVNRSDDTGSNTEGAYYVFPEDYMVEEYTQGVAALEEGTIGTELIESEDFGYFIVYRLPLSYDDVPTNYSSYGYTIRDLYVSDAFSQLIDQWNSEAEVVTNEVYDGIDMATFAQNLVDLSERLYPTEDEETDETASAETEAAETQAAETEAAETETASAE